MNWEMGIDIYTLMCIKWITNKNMLYKKINKIKFKNSKKRKVEEEKPRIDEIKNVGCTLGFMYIFELVFSFFLNIYQGVELLDHMVVLFLVF